jgi:hypothetical protein
VSCGACPCTIIPLESLAAQSTTITDHIGSLCAQVHRQVGNIYDGFVKGNRSRARNQRRWRRGPGPRSGSDSNSGPSCPSDPDGSPALPDDVLIVEDDAIIALDMEDTMVGFGVKTVRTRGQRGQGA